MVGGCAGEDMECSSCRLSMNSLALHLLLYFMSLSLAADTSVPEPFLGSEAQVDFLIIGFLLFRLLEISPYRSTRPSVTPCPKMC